MLACGESAQSGRSMKRNPPKRPRKSPRSAVGIPFLQGGGCQVISHVWSIVREWKGYFEAFGVSGGEIDKIGSAFRHALDMGGKEIGLF